MTVGELKKYIEENLSNGKLTEKSYITVACSEWGEVPVIGMDINEDRELILIEIA